MLASLLNQASDADAKFGELIERLSKQGNASNIPGLSNPGAAAASAAAATSISSAASKPISGYPGMGGGSSGFTTSASSYGANINAAAAAPQKQYFAYGQMPTASMNTKVNTATTSSKPINPYD